MNNKYELTDETKEIYFNHSNGDTITLHRIRALKNFDIVHKGDLGGFIEKEDNLSHDGDCWVYGNAEVSGNALVYDNARVCGDVTISNSTFISTDANISSNNDYLTIGNIGSRNDTTTFYKCNNNIIRVHCGCFNGTLEEFANKVKEVHGENRYAKEYMAAIEMAKIKLMRG